MPSCSVHEAYAWMKEVTFSKFKCTRCKLPQWIWERFVLFPLESSQIGHAYVRSIPNLFFEFFASRSGKPRNFFCVRFLRILKMFNVVPQLNLDVTFRVDDFSYIKLFNPSSYAKVMPILQISREILQIKSKFIFVNFPNN